MPFTRLSRETSPSRQLGSAYDLDKRRGGISVLLIDDHPVVRRALRDLLQAALIAEGRTLDTVDECGAIDEALALLGQRKHYDLVMTDLALPDATGTDAVARLTAVLPNTPVMVFSGDARVPVIREAIERGAMGYVIKNSALPILRIAIRTVLAGEIFTPANTISHSIEAPATARAKLSERQSRIAELAAKGESNKAIARAVHLSEDTVKYHLRHVYAQLGVSGRTTLRAVLAATPGISGS